GARGWGGGGRGRGGAASLATRERHVSQARVQRAGSGGRAPAGAFGPAGCAPADNSAATEQQQDGPAARLCAAALRPIGGVTAADNLAAGERGGWGSASAATRPMSAKS